MLWLVIHDIVVKEGTTKVFNFEVEDFHTYFVGENDVWTHNYCPRRPRTNIQKQVNHVDGSKTYTKTTSKGKTVDVTYNSNGYPDFSPYSQKEVKIDLVDGSTKDFSLANKAAGFNSKPKGYTWHHVEDMKTMQLVPTDIHRAFPHSGGASLFRNARSN
jgi:hypothetical protein